MRNLFSEKFRKMIDFRSVAVIIDCWDNLEWIGRTERKIADGFWATPNLNYIRQCESVYDNIVRELTHLNSVQAICLSTYNELHPETNTRAYENSCKLFKTNEIRKHDRIGKEKLRLHNTIASARWKQSYQDIYELYTMDQLKKVISHYNANQVYVLGISWTECVHKRQVGINSLKKQMPKDFSIRTLQNCTLLPHRTGNKVIDLDSYFVDMDNEPSMVKISHNIYEVKT